MSAKTITPKSESFDRNPYTRTLQLFASAINDFQGRVNPKTGNPIISNVSTQIMSNRAIDFAKVTIGEKVYTIENFQPARSLQDKTFGHDGNKAMRDHHATPSWLAVWSNPSSISDKGIEQETILNFLYMVASVITGEHARPKDQSWESVIKSYLALKAAELLGINWHEISFTVGVGEKDRTYKDYTGARVKQLIDFNAFDAIEALTFETKGKGRKVIQAITL